MKNVKIGIIQQYVSISNFGIKNRKLNLNRLQKNFNQLYNEIEDLDLVILPEEFYCGNSYNFTSLPESFEGSRAIDYLKELARKYKCCITTAITCSIDNKESDKRYRSIGIVIGRDGIIAGYQERVHIFEEEAEFITGGAGKNVIDLDFVRVGLIPGVDMMYPEIAQELVSKGAELLICSGLIASLSQEEANNNLLPQIMKYCTISRAMENKVFVVWVNGIGEAAHVKDGSYMGGSLLAGPLGIVKELSCNEEVAAILAPLDQIETANNFMNII